MVREVRREVRKRGSEVVEGKGRVRCQVAREREREGSAQEIPPRRSAQAVRWGGLGLARGGRLEAGLPGIVFYLFSLFSVIFGCYVCFSDCFFGSFSLVFNCYLVVSCIVF